LTLPEAIVGVRNIMTHEYFGVDLEEIWKTIEGDIPALESYISSIIREL